MAPHAPVISIIICKEDASSPQSIIQQYESTTVSTIKVAIMKITDHFRYEWKPSHAYQKLTLFVVKFLIFSVLVIIRSSLNLGSTSNMARSPLVI